MSRIRQFIKGEKGLGLVEILASMTLMTIVVLSFSSVVNGGATRSRSNNLENVATALAQEKMEEIKAAWPKTSSDFTSKVTGFNGVADSVAPNFNDTRTGITYNNGAAFTRTWTTSTADSALYGGQYYPKYLFQVKVKVEWDDPQNGQTVHRSQELVTYMTGR